MKYILEMNEAQAHIVSSALEFYSRMRMGQWRELIEHCLDIRDEKYCEKRDLMEVLLIGVRSVCYPELHHNWGHSYGVGNFEDADWAWEIHASIRHCIAWTEHPEGGWTVNFDKPWSFCGHEIAKCTAVKEDTNGEDDSGLDV